MGIDRHGTGGSRGWYGSSHDFAFQLFPELNIFPVSTAELQVADAAGMHYEKSTATLDLVGSGHRTKLLKDKFVMSTDDYLCFGGHPTKPGSQALVLGSGIDQAKASRNFLRDMSVPGVNDMDADSEVLLDVLAIEVYAFLDRFGTFLCTPSASASESRARYRSALEKYWAAPAQAPGETTIAAASGR
jgi:hypothetical protein